MASVELLIEERHISDDDIINDWWSDNFHSWTNIVNWRTTESLIRLIEREHLLQRLATVSKRSVMTLTGHRCLSSTCDMRTDVTKE